MKGNIDHAIDLLIPCKHLPLTCLPNSRKYAIDLLSPDSLGLVTSTTKSPEYVPAIIVWPDPVTGKHLHVEFLSRKTLHVLFHFLVPTPRNDDGYSPDATRQDNDSSR